MGRSFAELQASELTRAMSRRRARVAFAEAPADALCERCGAGDLSRARRATLHILSRRVRHHGSPRAVSRAERWDVVRFDEEFIGSNAAGLVAPGIDAIFVPDTALPIRTSSNGWRRTSLRFHREW